MNDAVEQILAATEHWPPQAVWTLLFGGALIEYVFPPFPGDTIAVAGAALVGAHGWSIAPIWASVTAGSVAGAGFDWLVGRAIARGAIPWLSPRTRRVIDDLTDRFQRYGSVYLALNRFLPGVRALLFVAAGTAGLPLLPVMGWASLSAALWNALLVGLGWWMGANIEGLTDWVQRYNQVVGIVIIGLLLLVAARMVRLLRSRGGERG